MFNEASDHRILIFYPADHSAHFRNTRIRANELQEAQSKRTKRRLMGYHQRRNSDQLPALVPNRVQEKLIAS